jgi:hypothetical protein
MAKKSSIAGAFSLVGLVEFSGVSLPKVDLMCF